MFWGGEHTYPPMGAYVPSLVPLGLADVPASDSWTSGSASDKSFGRKLLSYFSCALSFSCLLLAGYQTVKICQT
jgi:hypothetical protein